MVDIVSRLASGTGVGASGVTKASSSAPQEEAGSGAFSVKGISPRMTSDPVSGVLITEYLSSDGQVEMQIPSEAVVAYLRSGLTASGQVSREDAVKPPEAEILV